MSRRKAEGPPSPLADGQSSFPADTLPLATIEDSLERALEQGHTYRVLQYALRLRALRPHHAPTLLLLSMAVHDYTITSLPWNGTLRPAVRSSVERAALEQWALGLADSAAAVSENGPEWSKAVAWRGQIHEYLGDPLSALEAYREIDRRTRGVPHAAARRYWLEAHLRDPLLPDRIPVPRRVLGEGRAN